MGFLSYFGRFSDSTKLKDGLILNYKPKKSFFGGAVIGKIKKMEHWLGTYFANAQW